MLEASTRLSLTQLPLDVLHVIFHYIDIPDILRVRRVSRYLNQVSHSRHVWSNAYQIAKFVRPPGPFPSQSAHDLERTLVTSFRVDRYFRHGGGTPLKTREIRYTGADLRAKLVFGRFLFIAFKKKICYYDLNIDAPDGNVEGNVIYQTTGDLKWFDCVSAIDIEGRSFACAVLNEVTETTRRVSIYLLNIGEHFEVTLELLHQFEHSAFEIDSIELGPRVIIVQGRLGRTSNSNWHFVALDVYTRTQLLLPSIPAPWEVAEASERTIVSDGLPKSISTSTHLVQAWSSYSQASGWTTLFRAFGIPTPSTCSTFTSVLMNPSHQSTVPGINIRIGGPLLLHDAVVDSSTQDVLIVIRVHTSESTFSPLPSQHGVLRLNTTRTTGEHEVGAITFHPLGFLGNRDFVFHHPSFNGSGRVFELYLRSPNWVVAGLEYDLHDTVNHPGEQGAQVIEHPFVLQLPASHMRYLDYDPYSGRICLRYWTRSCSVVEIFDLSL